MCLLRLQVLIDIVIVTSTAIFHIKKNVCTLHIHIHATYLFCRAHFFFQDLITIQNINFKVPQC